MQGENLDAVTCVADSFKMADLFVGDRTGGAVAHTRAQTMVQADGLLWGQNRRLLIREMLR